MSVALRSRDTQRRSAVPVLTLLIVCLVVVTHQARLWAAPSTSTGTLKKKIGLILSDPVLKGAVSGVYVVSLPDGEALFSRNSDKLFTVASNMKLLTTAAALHTMGSGYQFTTTVYRRGDVSDEGTLAGDIVIRGGGDPNISGRFYGGRSTAIMEDWAVALQEAGITEITGDIVADDTFFDREYVHPGWPRNQLSRWYCAPVSGLSFNDNCVEIRLLADGNGGVKVVKEPSTGYVTVRNSSRLTKKKKGANLTVHKKPGTNEIVVKGKVRQRNLPATHFLTIDNPPLFFASVFKEVLERQGIKVNGRARLIGDADAYGDERGGLATELHELASMSSTLGQSVKVANTNSQNFYAEQILKTLGVEVKGEGSFAAGREVLSGFPRIIVGILAHMYGHREGLAFYSSLSVSGTTGTLKRRLTEPSYKGRVMAKTGYISKASSLSGYVETLSGKTLAFSILINNFKAPNSKIKKIQNSICRALVNY
jgi:D-alanyl-D-alanine carboxypeptidase/D-alanyl-D-alanine-endopeptidase (penicillin-binding protein 4)